MKTTKTPQYETIISTLLLLILCGIAVAVVVPQFRQRQTGGDSLENTIARLNPTGFTVVSGLVTYDADTLYEKIDGRAPLYTESGFEKLFTRLFKNDSNQTQTFELYIYDMAQPKNALAVFSQQKREDVQNISDVDFGYQTTNALFYSLGKYYIELVGSAQSAELLGAMSALAGQIKNALPAGDSVKAEEMQLLQKAGPQPGSVQFSIDNTFSCKELTNIFSAVIKIDNKPVTIFLSKRPDAKEAAALVGIYSKFLADIGAAEKKISLPTESARCFDFFGPFEVIFSNGRFLAGVHEAADTALAEKAAKSLNDILNGIKTK
jgi:hypothetical protein